MQFDHLEARILDLCLNSIYVPLFEYSIKGGGKGCGNYFQKLEKPIYKVLNFLSPPLFRK